MMKNDDALHKRLLVSLFVFFPPQFPFEKELTTIQFRPSNGPQYVTYLAFAGERS